MNYKVTEADSDSFTIWDGKTFHPDRPGKPMGEMTFLNMPGHGFTEGDIVQLTIRLIATHPSPDQEAIEKRLSEGAGSRLGGANL